MTEIDQSAPAVQRRFLLRGGAVLAGAAGITAVGAAMGSSTANAADGDNVVIGNEANAATTATGIVIGAGSDPALILTNEGGPALRLTPLTEDALAELEPGDLVGTDIGPLIGVDYGNGSELDYLVTGSDLDYIPTPVVVTPERLLDTRSVAGRANIIGGSSTLDSLGRLRAGEYIDVAVAPADDGFELGGAFLNVASGSSLGNGYLTVYVPGDRPNVSTLNFQKGTSEANAALVGLGIVKDTYAVRIHSSQTTHILLDLSGVIISAPTPELSPAQTTVGTQARQRRVARQAKRANKMRKSLRSVQ